MRTTLHGLYRSERWEWWQFFYVVLSLSWLLSPNLNHHLSRRITYISQYEDPGQPWSWLFRAGDIAAALLLGLAIWVIARGNRGEAPVSKFWRLGLILLGIIALGSGIDDLFPSACHTNSLVCLVPGGLSRIIHSGESVITACSLIALNLLCVIKKMPWAKPVLAAQLLWSAVFLINQLTARPNNSLAQFAYQLVITLWIATLVPLLAGWRTAPKDRRRPQVAIHVIAAWVFFGGFIAIADSIRNIREISEHSAAYFGDNTAWLSQHGIAVGIMLMYISRHLWRGEYRAWQLTSLLLWLETLKYAVITPDADLVLVYGLTASVLFVLRSSFDRLTSVEDLRERLKKLAFVALAFVVALLAGVIALRLKYHQDVDSLRINFGQFSRHFFLFDVVNDLGSLPRRLLGQALNVAGLALLLTILVSLFRPHKPLLKHANGQDRKQLLNLLGKHSNSSEDYFKYWPRPKNYWRDSADQAIIAYQVVGNVAFALADPVTRGTTARSRAIKEFLDYCRQHGWRACFLMVAGSSRDLYKKNAYKLFRIGASAVVDIEQFSSETARNKWWRWVLNKATKQHWEYSLALPPHKSRLISEIHGLSDTWLRHQNHVERGFALGYFDETYLQGCRLHLLRHEGNIIAFANELPIFNNLPTTTVDLMRFLPDYKHSMPTLLAHIIKQLHEEGVKRKFDLGFVPLASPAARTEQVIQKVGQRLMSEAVSAQGLEQFKNKFAPDWSDNYIAFDGDWIDLIHISRQLDDLLRP